MPWYSTHIRIGTVSVAAKSLGVGLPLLLLSCCGTAAASCRELLVPAAARPLLADIICEDSKKARVRVEGRANVAPFVVERTASRRRVSEGEYVQQWRWLW